MLTLQFRGRSRQLELELCRTWGKKDWLILDSRSLHQDEASHQYLTASPKSPIAATPSPRTKMFLLFRSLFSIKAYLWRLLHARHILDCTCVLWQVCLGCPEFQDADEPILSALSKYYYLLTLFSCQLWAPVAISRHSPTAWAPARHSRDKKSNRLPCSM